MSCCPPGFPLSSLTSLWHSDLSSNYSQNTLHSSPMSGDELWSVFYEFIVSSVSCTCCFNTLRLRQNGEHLADFIFKCIFFNENVWISTKISLNFVPKGQINNIPALVQIMAWRRPGDKPLPEPMMGNLLTHISFTRPQWVNDTCISRVKIYHAIKRFGCICISYLCQWPFHSL